MARTIFTKNHMDARGTNTTALQILMLLAKYGSWEILQRGLSYSTARIVVIKKPKGGRKVTEYYLFIHEVDLAEFPDTPHRVMRIRISRAIFRKLKYDLCIRNLKSARERYFVTPLGHHIVINQFASWLSDMLSRPKYVQALAGGLQFDGFSTVSDVFDKTFTGTGNVSMLIRLGDERLRFCPAR